MNCSGQRGDLRNWEGEEERRKGENGSAIGSHGHLDEEVIRSRKRRRGEEGNYLAGDRWIRKTRKEKEQEPYLTDLRCKIGFARNGGFHSRGGFDQA